MVTFREDHLDPSASLILDDNQTKFAPIFYWLTLRQVL